MKKVIYILASVFLTITMQAQIIPQPKPGPAPKPNVGKPETFELKKCLKTRLTKKQTF